MRPEFRVDVLVPAVGDPILGTPACAVPGCVHSSRYAGLCLAHLGRWKQAGRPDRSGVGGDRGSRGDGPSTAAIVPGARMRVRPASVSVVLHAFPSMGESRTTAGGSVEATGGRAPAAVCAIPGCALWAELDGGWCRSHHARWRQHGRPPTAEFIAHCVSYGEDRFDFRRLPPQLRLEIGYALQCRVDANRTRTTPRSIKPLLDHLVASGAGSLLERPLADWLAGLPAAASINTPRAFLGYAIECLLDLRDGTGWDSEYERDVWLLRRLGVAGHDGARLDFTAVQPLWLRELAKRWCRWRMSCGVGLGQLRKDRIALVRLSRLTPGLASSTDPNALDRVALEGYLARLAVELPHPKTRSTDIGCRDRVSACRAPAPVGIAARRGAAVSQRPTSPRRNTGTAGDSRVRPAPARRPRQPRPDHRPADPAASGDPHPHRTAHRRRHPAGVWTAWSATRRARSICVTATTRCVATRWCPSTTNSPP